MKNKCKKCNTEIQYTKYEEKETDVALGIVVLGIQVVHDVNTIKDLEKIIIISGDTDFVPVINYVLSNTDIKVKVLIPISEKDYHYSEHLKHTSIQKKHIESQKYKNYAVSNIKHHHIELSKLDDYIKHEEKIYKNPYI